MSLNQTTQKVRDGSLKAEELCQQSLDVIQNKNPELNAVLRTSEFCIKQAQALDENPKGSLAGLPLLVKDNFCVKGLVATAGSKILENFHPPYTAHCISKLESKGAIVVGKANLDEFGMGSSNENSAFGVCKNPWNLDCVPGGSSGGSAAAVASDMVPVAIGSDTGGSIRQPASFCGVVGIKPTYGAVSRFGLMAFASSLDQAGTFSKSVNDGALVLEAMIDKDSRDATNVPCSFDFSKKPDKKWRVGVPNEYFELDLSDEVRKSIVSLIETLKSEGHEIVPVDLPHTSCAIPVYYLVACSEASSNLSRYDGVRYGKRDVHGLDGREVRDLKSFYSLTRSRGFGEEVKRRVLLGTFALSAGYYDAFYTKACQVRRLIAQDFIKAFQSCDVLVGPVTTQTAFRLGEKTGDPIAMYNNDVLTTPSSLAGLPSMSLPLGLDSKGLPIGLQIISPAFSDDSMVDFARQVEEIANFQEVPVGS